MWSVTIRTKETAIKDTSILYAVSIICQLAGLVCMALAALVMLTYPWQPDEGAEAAGVAALVAALAALVAGLVAGRGRGGLS